MPTPANRAGGRGLIAVAVIVVLALVVADLLRSDSLLRGAWNELMGPRSQIQRMLEGFRQRGPQWR